MARICRTGTRNWARGVFATFWILLGGISGAYLFTAFTNPTALGGQLVASEPGRRRHASVRRHDRGDRHGASGDERPGDRRDQRASAQLTDQVAELNARFKRREVGPVAALAPATSVTTSMPAHGRAGAGHRTQEARGRRSPPLPAAARTSGRGATRQPRSPSPPRHPRKRPSRSSRPRSSPPRRPSPRLLPREPPAVAVSPLEEDAPEEGASRPRHADAGRLPPRGSLPPCNAQPAPPATESAALDPTALPPAANDGSTRYGIEIGSVAKQDGLRPLWREFLTNHAALVAGLQPRRVLAPDKKWRLIAGPFGSADEASQACALFKKASRPCEATVYAGDSL